MQMTTLHNYVIIHFLIIRNYFIVISHGKFVQYIIHRSGEITVSFTLLDVVFKRAVALPKRKV